MCVSPFEKKAENPSRLAWPFQLQGGLVLLPVTIPVKPSTPAGAGPVVRETGGASLRLPTAAVLDSSLQGWPQSPSPSSPRERAWVCMRNLLQREHSSFSGSGEAAAGGSIVIASPFLAHGALAFFPCLPVWVRGLCCAPYLESLRAPDFLFHLSTHFGCSWKHR